MAGSSNSNHPDAVLTVPAEVGDPVKENIWRCFKLTAHLENRRVRSSAVGKLKAKALTSKIREKKN